MFVPFETAYVREIEPCNACGKVRSCKINPTKECNRLYKEYSKCLKELEIEGNREAREAAAELIVYEAAQYSGYLPSPGPCNGCKSGRDGTYTSCAAWKENCRVPLKCKRAEWKSHEKWREENLKFNESSERIQAWMYSAGTPCGSCKFGHEGARLKCETWLKNDRRCPQACEDAKKAFKQQQHNNKLTVRIVNRILGRSSETDKPAEKSKNENSAVPSQIWQPY